jgi:hypothetical protein
MPRMAMIMMVMVFVSIDCAASRKDINLHGRLPEIPLAILFPIPPPASTSKFCVRAGGWLILLISKLFLTIAVLPIAKSGPYRNAPPPQQPQSAIDE